MNCCPDDLTINGTTIVLPLNIITCLDFCWRFQLLDPNGTPIDNPDFDPSQPVDDINSPLIQPPLDLNNYLINMDIRAGTTKSSTLIYELSTVIGNITVNDPSLGWVKVFIGRADTGLETGDPDNPGIADFAAKCAHYSLIVDPNVPGEKNYELYNAPIHIKESNTDV